MTMIGHIDCNSFFVSCERVFRPDVARKPVIVLSNNDGCICSLSAEAKALGMKRGDPYFKVKAIAEQGGTVVFSGNHKLYHDMSRRVMDTLRSLSEQVEVYSVDDAFMMLDPGSATAEYGRYVIRRLRRDTGIPASMGIAPTKTLAKLASHFAKRYPAYRGVAVIDTTEKARKAMALVKVEDVWGIGRRLAARLRRCGVDTALQLADLPKEKAKAILGNVVSERTWRELNGEPCIGHELVAPDKKMMTTSRTFAAELRKLTDLERAVATFVTIVSRKLREQGSVAARLTVFIATNRFNEHEEQLFDSATFNFLESTADVLVMTRAAILTLRRLWRNGLAIKRAGVTLTDISPAEALQQSLFADTEKRNRRRALMRAVDAINASGVGRDMVHTAVSASSALDGLVRRKAASRLYSTRISDIIEVNVDK